MLIIILQSRQRMSKFVNKNLIEMFLFMSPHRTLERFSNITPAKVPLSVNQNKDELYIESFMYKVHCQYLATEQYHHLQSKQSKMLKKMIVQQYSPTLLSSNLSQSKNSKSQTETKLIQTVKKMNGNWSQFSIYQEIEETLVQLTPQEAYIHKKYLIYCYKIILNRKYQVNEDLKQFADALKKLVVGKIYEGHNQLAEHNQVKQELNRIQVLVRARKSKDLGDNQVAKVSYQKIFEDQNNDENVRMQALEYLCSKSQEKGDEGYLLGLVSKIKNSKNERHLKFIENSLNKLNQNRSKQKRNDSKTINQE